MSSPNVQRSRPMPMRSQTAAPTSPPTSAGVNGQHVRPDEPPEDLNKSPFTYALHVVFTSFVRIAEKKINSVVTSASDPEPDVAAALTAGADPGFDKVLRNLAFIARQNPKPVIDSVMFWRKSRAELRNDAASPVVHEAGEGLSAIRRHEAARPSFARSPSMTPDNNRDASILADRRSLVSIHILCRTLIELIAHVNAEALTPDVGEKLEEIVFNQLRSADPDLLMSSPLRLANWNLFVELLGGLSGIRFDSVSDRFIADLEKHGRGIIPRERETHVEMLISGMRHLKLRLYPARYLEDSADFLLSLSKFFIESHGYRIKRAYANVLHRIVLPVAPVATAETSFPAWTEAVNLLYPRTIKMIEKAKYWDVGFPLAATLLCVSPQAQFIERWFSLIENNLSKLKEKFFQPILVDCIAHLVWVATYRCREPAATLIPKLESIMRMVLPATRKPPQLDTPKRPLIAAISFVGAQYPEQIFHTVQTQLLTQDVLRLERLPLEQLYAERMSIGLSALHAIVLNAQREAPVQTFPIDFTNIEKDTGEPGPNQLKGQMATTFDAHRNAIAQTVARLLFVLDSQLVSDTTGEEWVRTPIGITSPMAHAIQSRDRAAIGELAATVIRVCPVFLTATQINAKLIELLCRATLSSDIDIQHAARGALLALAHRHQAQTVVAAFTRIILRTDSRPRPGMQDRIEMYLNLIRIWLSHVQDRALTPSPGPPTSDSDGAKGHGVLMNTVWPVVDEIESAGMLLLCSQSRNVRVAALKILSLVKEFDATADAARPQGFHRVIDIFGHETHSLIAECLEHASIAERGRISKLKHETTEALRVVAESESGVDAAIWFKAFPMVIRRAFELFPTTIVMTRNIICERLPRMQETVAGSVAHMRNLAPFEVASSSQPRIAGSPESLVDQWKLYLIVACITLTAADDSGARPAHDGHNRSASQASMGRVTSARGIFHLIFPFLTSESAQLRDSIVTALGCININLFKPLLEDLRPMMRSLAEHTRQIRHFSRQQIQRFDLLREQIADILRLNDRFLALPEILKDDWCIETLLHFLKDTKIYLMSDHVQNSFEHQKLRRHFCGLLQGVWEGIADLPRVTDLFPFDGRVSCFRLIEEWCGHGPYEQITNARADHMRQAIIQQHRDIRDQGALTATMELEKRQVEQAALQAMASLCRGPVYQAIESSGSRKVTMSFDIDALFAWIAALFDNTADKTHEIGRRALASVLKSNATFPKLYQEAIHQCYTHDFDSKAARSYFLVLAKVLIEDVTLPCPISQLVALCLFKAGDKSHEVRRRTLDLLRSIEVRAFGSSCVDAFEPMICNQDPVIYKKAQYLLAARLAQDREHLKFLLFSECSKFFRLVETRLQRDVVAILLPYMQTIELQAGTDDVADDLSHMVLVNLFEITLRFSDTLLNEIEGLWAVLLAKTNTGNAKIILDFILQQSVARREPKFVKCAKQVIVYLSRSPSGANVVSALLLHLEPRSMIPQVREASRRVIDGPDIPYVADLDRVFEVSQRGVVFSMGQLALIFIVDLLVEPAPGLAAHVHTLLQAIFVMLDHYVGLVQDQAKELLMYLGHGLTMQADTPPEQRAKAVAFLKGIRQRDSKGFWTYDELACPNAPKRAPANMLNIVEEVLAVCEGAVPDLRKSWAKLALSWATSCPVRHMACRAFQVFRCLATDLTQETLADMLARLSNTIADESRDIEVFAMEILYTMRHVVSQMQAKDFAAMPQLFWATVACLDTVHEDEFLEACDIVELIIAKVDLAADENVSFLLSKQPPQWEGGFDGVFKLLLKGVRSDRCSAKCLRLLNQLIKIPSNALAGGDSRLLDCLLVNLPSFVYDVSRGQISPDNEATATNLAAMAQQSALDGLQRIMTSFSKSRFRNSEDFTKQIVNGIRASFFPQYEAHVLVTWLGLLSHRQSWVKIHTMDLLKTALPFVDTGRVEFAGVGADLISPLLRLLQTELAPLALDVLDKAISIRGGPKDRQVLRMSLGNRTVRKEYEKTATLFGIPDDSGWAIPVPTVAASTTRSNIHAVFYTCTPDAAQEETQPAPVQFHIEEYNYRAPSDRSDTMLSLDPTDSNLGDMVSALHNLDVFFAEDVATAAKGSVAAGAPPQEAAPVAVYDSRVAAILARSLTRTPSTSSFTSPGFDTSPNRSRQALSSPSTDRMAMTPLASGYAFPRQARPGITAPVTNNSRPDDIESDGDDLTRSPPRVGGGFVLGARSNGSTPETTSPTVSRVRLAEPVLEDDRSEASFKLDSLLSGSGNSSKASSKEYAAARKAEKAAGLRSTKTSPPPANAPPATGRGMRYKLWSSSGDRHRAAAAAGQQAVPAVPGSSSQTSRVTSPLRINHGAARQSPATSPIATPQASDAGDREREPDRDRELMPSSGNTTAVVSGAKKSRVKVLRRSKTPDPTQRPSTTADEARDI